MTIAELVEGAERLLHEVRAYAALREARDAHRALQWRRRCAAYLPPSGCAFCGLARHPHAELETYEGIGWHAYVTPTTDQIKTRMLARRYGSGQHATTTDMEK